MSDKETEGWKVGDLVLNLVDLTVGEVVDTDSHTHAVCPLDGIRYPVQVRRLTHELSGSTGYFYIDQGTHDGVLRIHDHGVMRIIRE